MFIILGTANTLIFQNSIIPRPSHSPEVWRLFGGCPGARGQQLSFASALHVIQCGLCLLLEITLIAQPQLWEFWSLVFFSYRLLFPPRAQGVRTDGNEDCHQAWSHHLVFWDLLKLHVCFIQSNSGKHYVAFPFANLWLMSFHVLVKLN